MMALCAVFAVCQAYAQENIEGVDQEVMPMVDSSQTPEVTPQNPPQTPPQEQSDLAQTNALLTQLVQQMMSEDSPIQKWDPINGKIVMPIQGKSKFAQKHFIYQQVGISTNANKDKDMDPSSEDSDMSSDQAKKVDGASDIVSKLGFGLNIDYTLTFVPGRITDAGLELNKMGFAWSVGYLAAFDRQDKYEVTCDFMAKFGIVAGAEHPLGVGIDFLFGGGKSAGTMFDLDDEKPEEDPDYYTEWCWKFGSEVWIKTNILQTSIPNTDILVFARYVRSINPYNDDLLLKEQKLFNMFNEESWVFGMTLRYKF